MLHCCITTGALAWVSKMQRPLCCWCCVAYFRAYIGSVHTRTCCTKRQYRQNFSTHLCSISKCFVNTYIRQRAAAHLGKTHTATNVCFNLWRTRIFTPLESQLVAAQKAEDCAVKWVILEAVAELWLYAAVCNSQLKIVLCVSLNNSQIFL